jgi:hypothetical protein
MLCGPILAWLAVATAASQATVAPAPRLSVAASVTRAAIDAHSRAGDGAADDSGAPVVSRASISSGQASDPEVPLGPRAEDFQEAPVELWAGHLMVTGSRSVPLLGRRETHTESWVLAHVRRDARGLDFVQDACRIENAEVVGVSTRIDPISARALPSAHFRLERIADDASGGLGASGASGASGTGGDRGAVGASAPDGSFTGRWRAGFDARDWDRDGEPGLSIEVSAPLCKGRVFVASETRNRARAREQGDRLEGEIVVDVHQRLLGASSWCLGLGGKDTRDTQRGTLTYARVPDETTCDDLARSGWPATRP